jgi:hypothetical protein
MIAPGTRHSANSTAPVPTVTLAPNAMPATTINPTAANQICITLDRLITFMVFTYSMDAFRFGFEYHHLSPSLSPAPQPKPTSDNELALLRFAKFLDHLLDASQTFIDVTAVG